MNFQDLVDSPTYAFEFERAVKKYSVNLAVLKND